MLQTASRAAVSASVARAPRQGSQCSIIHDLDGAGPIYAAADGPGGRRYFSDEFHHRVVVEETTGYRWSFGREGSGAGELRQPRGLAVRRGRRPEETRLFVCDARNHRVQVFDGNGRACYAFGSNGRGNGQFDVPSDVALVRPEYPGEEVARVPEADWLAVADRWNNRVQVFELDGSFIGTIGWDGRPGTARPAPPDAGWPFFRIGLDPTIWFPVRLAWKAPHLEVVSANGSRLRVNLALALLPDFDTWRRRATVAELAEARDVLSAQPERARPPADVLAAIARDLCARRPEGGPEPSMVPGAALVRRMRLVGESASIWQR